MENEGLRAKLTLGKKLKLVMEYMQNGGEVTVNGAIYVWLDNYNVREFEQEDGTIEYIGIDGLAIKATRYNTETQETKPMYIGQSDMPLRSFIKLVENLTEDDWLDITASNTMHSMRPKR